MERAGKRIAFAALLCGAALVIAFVIALIFGAGAFGKNTPAVEGTAASASVTVPEGQTSAHDWTHTGEGVRTLDVYDNVLTGGKYYLAADTTVKTGLTVRGEAEICLNGYALSREGEGSVITVENGASLTICDCGEHKQRRVYAKTGSADNSPYTAVPEEEIDTVLSGSVNAVSFECGVITGGNAENGGGVYVNGNGKLTMLSGAIAGNKAAVVNNKYRATNCGGGIYLAGGAEAVVSGGVITGNLAGEEGNYTWDFGKVGGGIMAELSANLTVEGNALIQGNAAKYGGGGIAEGWNGYPVYASGSYENYLQKVESTKFNLGEEAHITDNTCGDMRNGYNLTYSESGDNLLLVAWSNITGGCVSDGDVVLGELYTSGLGIVNVSIQGGKFDTNFKYISHLYDLSNAGARFVILANGGYFTEEARNSFDSLRGTAYGYRSTMARTDEYNAEQAQIAAEGYIYGIFPSSQVINGQYYAGGALNGEGGTLSGGRYFLTQDITASAEYTVEAGSTAVVNMNGKSMSSSTNADGVFVVQGGTLIIEGSSEEGNLSASMARNCVEVKSGRFIMQGGRLIVNGTATTDRAVSVDPSGAFEMRGGIIVRYAAAQGYAVETRGAFTMTGGEILSSDPSAVALHAAGGSAGITGGSVGNIAVNINCKADMSGGTVGDVTLTNGAEFNMSGGTAGNITAQDGVANISGGYVDSASSSGGTLNITGGYFATSPAAGVASDYAARAIDADFDKNFIEGYGYGVYAQENIHEDRLAVPITSDMELDGGGISSLYYLEDNVYGAAIRVTGNVELCLNGKVLQGTNKDSVIVVEDGASLTLCNCVEGGASYITGGGTNFEGGGIRVLGGTLIIKGGTITGNSAVLGGDGVYVRGGTLEMSGGTIEGDVLAVNSQVSVTGGYFSSDVSEYVADGYVCVPTNELTVDENDKGVFGVYKSGVTEGYFAVSVNGMHEYTGSALKVSVNGSIADAPVSVSVRSAYEGASPVIRFFTNGECTLPIDASEVKDAGVYYMLVSLASHYDEQTRTYYPAASSEPVMVRINPKTLTVTGVSAADRYYDGTAEVGLYGEAVLSGVIAGEEDTVSVVLGAGTLADKNAGTNKAVSTNITLTGDGAHNYALVQPEDVTADISPLPLYAEGFSAQDKTYDGTTDITVAEGDVYGVYEGDDVTVTASGVAESANAGSGVGVTITYTLSIPLPKKNRR